MRSSFSEEECEHAGLFLEQMEGMEGRRTRGARASMVNRSSNQSGRNGSSRNSHRNRGQTSRNSRNSRHTNRNNHSSNPNHSSPDTPSNRKRSRDGGTRPGREELNSDEESESDDDYQYDNASGTWKLKRRPGRRRGSGRGSGSGRERKTLTEQAYGDYCVLCEDGGELIICDGPCLRTFHMQCLGMDEMPDGRQWFCPDCQNKKHICLICGLVGTDAQSNTFPFAKKDDGFCCSMVRCGRYYHKSCLESKSEKVTFFTGTVGEARSVPSKFRCPQHYCATCDVIKTSGGSMMMKCNRCECSYHMTCVDKSKTQRISKSNIVCEKHCPEGQTYRWTKTIGSRSQEEDDLELAMNEDARNAANPPKRPRLNDALVPLHDPYDPNWSGAEGGEGAEDSTSSSSSTSSSQMPACSLCAKPWEHKGVEGKMLGPFYVGSGKAWVHEECANFAPEVFVDEKNRYCNVVSAVKRSRRTSCGDCSQGGATIGCIVGTCKSSYHLGCAFDSGWTFAAGDSTFICPKHRLDDSIETWCYCKTPVDRGGFWMQCNMCENWFHPR